MILICKQFMYNKFNRANHDRFFLRQRRQKEPVQMVQMGVFVKNHRKLLTQLYFFDIILLL